jgi:hypothetical protein
MNIRRPALFSVFAFIACVATGAALVAPLHAELSRVASPGGRVLLDAHNCYPEHDHWADRIERALSNGTPIAIEQDLVWIKDPNTGEFRSVLAHNPPYTGHEPILKEHFFERIRPIVERALRENRREDWPIIVLNLDLKSNEPEHHASIWKTLGEYESWLTTAEKTDDPTKVMPLDVKPVLVLTGDPVSQEQSFFTSQPVGTKLRVFGAIRTEPPPNLGTGQQMIDKLVDLTAEEVVPSAPTNYRRWANYPWAVVERGGQPKAADWTAADRARLKALVDRAHSLGLWIRFYTLDGFDPADNKGWTISYNFGSESAARARWQAAIDAGVDFVATDQYELFAATLKQHATARR